MLLLAGCRSVSPTGYVELIPGRHDRVGFYSAFDDWRGFESLEKEIGEADFEFHLDEVDRLIPASGSSENSLLLPPSAAAGSEALTRSDRTFRGFVVVQLHKLAQIDSVEQKVSRVNDYFFSRGAQRVLITGFRGSGRAVYSDKVTKPNKQRREARVTPLAA